LLNYVRRRKVAEIGKTEYPHEIGLKGTNKRIWLPCKLCKKERWVQLKEDTPMHDICSKCSHLPKAELRLRMKKSD